MKIQIIEENVRDYDAEAIVILTSGKGELAISSDLHSQIKKLSQSSAHQRKFKGEAGDLLVYRSFGEAASPHIIFVGVADKQHLRAETMRNVGAHRMERENDIQASSFEESCMAEGRPPYEGNSCRKPKENFYNLTLVKGYPPSGS